MTGQIWFKVITEIRRSRLAAAAAAGSIS